MSNEQPLFTAKLHWIVALLVAPVLGLLGSKVVVSAKRVSGKFGLVGTREVDIDLASVRSATAIQGGLGKALGFGTVVIETDSDTESFGFVQDPEGFAGAVERARSKPAPKPAPKPASGSRPLAEPRGAAPAPAVERPAAEAPIVGGAAAATSPREAENVETATQSTTNNPDEVVAGKTMAMSSFDFEKMLREHGGNKS
jgi:hypothetical protein